MHLCCSFTFTISVRKTEQQKHSTNKCAHSVRNHIHKGCTGLWRFTCNATKHHYCVYFLYIIFTFCQLLGSTLCMFATILLNLVRRERFYEFGNLDSFSRRGVHYQEVSFNPLHFHCEVCIISVVIQDPLCIHNVYLCF